MLLVMALALFGCSGEPPTDPNADGGGGGGGGNPPGGGGTPSLSSEDKQYLQEAGQGAAMEVILGGIALTHASHDSVKAFASLMVRDHSSEKIQDSLICVAVGQPVPHGPSASQQGEIDRLAQLHGSHFDRAYISFMVSVHQDDVDSAANESDSGTHPQVRTFAGQMLPILRVHLAFATRVSVLVRSD
jgi:putative membrane protein